MIVGKKSNFIGLDIKNQIEVENFAKDLDSDIRLITTAINGKLRFGDGSDGKLGENISGEFQVISDTGVSDTEFSVTHTVNAVPIGYIVTKIDKGGVIYDSGTAWTSTTIYLKCSAANAAVTIFLIK